MLGTLTRLFIGLLPGSSSSTRRSGSSDPAQDRDTELSFSSPHDPNKIYTKPADVAYDHMLQREQKLSILSQWAAIANQRFRETKQIDLLNISREANNIKNFLYNEIAVENEKLKFD